MITLDCESRDSTISSISSIYGVTVQEVKRFIRETDIEKHYAKINPPHTYDIELTRLFEKTYSCVPLPIDRVFWFHLTRGQQGLDFVRGLLPLNEALDGIWDTILSIFCGTRHEANLRAMKESGVSTWLYRFKVGDPRHGGPYAMLVREAAFRSREIGNHDYLHLPEIMEDICNGYQEAFGDVIHDYLKSFLVPYIIKFWSTDTTHRHLIEPAMYYLYCITHGQTLSIDANTCFDGKNSRIPREQIVKIEALCGYNVRTEDKS